MFHSLVLRTSRFVQGGRVFLQGGPHPPPSGLGPSVLFGQLLLLPSESLTPDQPQPEFLAATTHVFLGKPIILSFGDFSDALWSVRDFHPINKPSLFLCFLDLFLGFSRKLPYDVHVGVSLTFFPRACEVTGAACLFSALKNLLPRIWRGSWGGPVGSAGPPGPVHPGGLSCLNGHAGPVMEGGSFLHSVFSFVFFWSVPFLKKLKYIIYRYAI